MVCRTTNVTNRIFIIAAQVGMMFLFLTIFFFVYVTRVERTEFENQIRLAVDDLVRPYLKDLSFIKDQNILIVLSGILSAVDEEVKRKATAANEDVTQNNANVLRKALLMLALCLTIVLVVSLSLMALGFFVPLAQYSVEILITTLIIAVVEFLFFEIVTKNYISIEPNQIRQQVLQEIVSFAKSQQ